MRTPAHIVAEMHRLAESGLTVPEIERRLPCIKRNTIRRHVGHKAPHGKVGRRADVEHMRRIVDAAAQGIDAATGAERFKYKNPHAFTNSVWKARRYFRQLKDKDQNTSALVIRTRPRITTGTSIKPGSRGEGRP